MNVSTRAAAACLFAVLCTVAFAQDGPPEIEADPGAPYTHDASGAVFPAKIDALERASLHRYDQDGLNVSAGYRQAKPQFTITVYVYPDEGESLADHFEKVTGDIQKVHKGVKLLEKREWKLAQDGRAPHDGRRAKFAIAGFAGREVEMISELYLLDVGPWFVKYRVSYPATSGDAAAKVIAAVHDAVKVPKGN